MGSIFGYGSLIFKPPPVEDELQVQAGYIKGFVRRFAQLSHDHRGTHESPGRVVTLCTAEDWLVHQKDEPPENGHIWGNVYRIPSDPQRAKEIWAYLDHREKDGYTMRTVDVFGVGEEGEEIVVEKDCKVYVGETDNPSFGGGTPMLELAEQIASSVGPSGPNKEYLYMLCEALRRLGGDEGKVEEDVYLTELERLVRAEDQRLQRSEESI